MFPLFFAACALIDDDLSVCGEELIVHYQMELHTELSLQLQAELDEVQDEPVRDALETWLAPVFTDHAKDINLRFFSLGTDELRYSVNEVINAKQKSYTLVLPTENYMHLALANMADNHQVQLLGDNHAEDMHIYLSENNYLNPLNTGMFTARLPMEVTTDSSQNFDVRLYMVTAAVALVIDTTECDSVFTFEAKMKDCACGFALRDSLFDYSSDRLFRFEEVEIKLDKEQKNAPTRESKEPVLTTPYACMATVGMPTPDSTAWHIEFVTTLTKERHTTTTMTIDDPLKAGTLRVFKLRMKPDGSIEPKVSSKEVGISITLDWKNGGDHDIEV